MELHHQTGATPDVDGYVKLISYHLLTTAQALARARATGTAVPVDGATTPTDTLTANANGTLTLTRTVVPVRKRAGGAWVPLDPTLRRNADGANESLSL